MLQNDKDPHGDPEGFVIAPNALRCSASLVLIVKGAADTLERHYPGWLWAIQPDERGGVVNILSMRLSGKWGYTLKVGTLQADVNHREVVRAGGELLERFGFRAAGYDREAWRHKDRVMGDIAADVSDMDGKRRREYRTAAIRRAVDSGHARITTDTSIGAALRHG